MSFKSQTYRVLIASPSDLAEERQAATEAVNDWNAQHAVAEAVVLLRDRGVNSLRPLRGHCCGSRGFKREDCLILLALLLQRFRPNTYDIGERAR